MLIPFGTIRPESKALLFNLKATSAKVDVCVSESEFNAEATKVGQMMEMGLYIVCIVVSLVSLVSVGMIAIKAFKRSPLWGLTVFFVPFVVLVYGFKFLPEVRKPFYAYLGSAAVMLVLSGYLFTMMGGMAAIDLASKINDGTLTEQDAAQFMVAEMGRIEKLSGEGKDDIISQMQQEPTIRPEDVAQTKKLFEPIEGMASGEITSFEMMTSKSEAQAAVPEPAATEQDIKKAEEALKQAMAMLEPVPQGTASSDKSAATTIEPDAATALEAASQPTEEKVATQQKTTSPPPPVTAGPVSLARAGQHIGQPMEIIMKAGNKRYGQLDEVNNGTLVFVRQAYGGSISYKLNASDIKTLRLNN